MNLPAALTLTLVLMPQEHALPDADTATPPIAARKPVELRTHGHRRIDEYFWLNQREDPEVIAYLEAENAYTEAMTAHTKDLREHLFEEIKGRVKQTDQSVPYRLWDYWYYTRMEDGKAYPIFCRKHETLEADEEVMLDVNAMAEGQDYCSVQPHEISPGQDLLAYAQDLVGRRIYTIRFRDLANGADRPDVIENVTGSLVWANDNRTVFYTRQDPETLRSYQVYRHVLGAPVADDVLVYQEDDEEFRVGVSKSTSREFLFVGSFQTLRDEYRYLRADDPEGEWRLFLAREDAHEYDLDHYDGRFFVRSNREALNFRLFATAEDQTGSEHWQEVVPHRDDVFFLGADFFRDFLVVSERAGGLVRLRIVPWDGGEEHSLDFGEPAYAAGVSTNPDPDTDVLRYSYTSLTTPPSTYDYDMRTRQKTLKKQQEILGGFDREDYVTERLQVEARDGTAVPVSLVYRKGTPRDGTAPLLLYGYGSYGITVDASFRPERLSLIDRGFIFAIAHVRGSQVHGRRWYEDGKLLNKLNTFTDFLDCGHHLVAQKYTSPGRLFAMGGSAGGLLVGAVINMDPSLFHGVVAAVPFVDIVTTMLDDSIPLTTFEYDEWGNPNVKEYYDYMLSYSPYDNVTAQDYPHLLVTTGLHDSQVQYWEPAKWVARLRARKTDDHLLLLRTNMEAGHGGASGRYDRYEEIAFDYAFLLDLAGVKG